MKPAALISLGVVIGATAFFGFSRLSVNQKDAVPNASPALSLNDNPPPEFAQVSEVIDGITIKLDTGHIVRYIGVNTPDVEEEIRCFGKEAVLANESIIGSTVRLEEEPLLLRSRDGAWTRYVWLIQGEVDPSSGEASPVVTTTPVPIESPDPSDIFVNERILEGGFGFPIVSEDMVYGERLLSAARFSSATGKGLWSRCEIETAEDETPQTALDTECNIKGVVFNETNHVYRTPQCAAYASTIVLQSSGGQWFCSEDEAKEAGFEAAPDCQ